MEDLKSNITNKINEGSSSLVENLKKYTRIDYKNWLNNLPLLLFVAILGIIHVANNHMVEYKVREINTLEREIKEMRWHYMTSKSQLMFQSKQSEVAKMVEEFGLQELKSPPFKIEVEKDEY